MKLRDGTTAILRLVHIDNLAAYVERDALHAAEHTPADRFTWRATHRPDVQGSRATAQVPKGPGGVLLDYVPFYFGARSPMLYQLHTGWVPGHVGGQTPMVYLVASADEIGRAGHGFVFYDGHALAAFSRCFDDLADLAQLDWPTIHADFWAATADDPDRQRRKQAELLVHRAVPWSLIRGIVTLNPAIQAQVRALLASHPQRHQPGVAVNPKWYYD